MHRCRWGHVPRANFYPHFQAEAHHSCLAFQDTTNLLPRVSMRKDNHILNIAKICFNASGSISRTIQPFTWSLTKGSTVSLKTRICAKRASSVPNLSFVYTVAFWDRAALTIREFAKALLDFVAREKQSYRRVWDYQDTGTGRNSEL